MPVCSCFILIKATWYYLLYKSIVRISLKWILMNNDGFTSWLWIFTNEVNSLSHKSSFKRLFPSHLYQTISSFKSASAVHLTKPHQLSLWQRFFPCGSGKVWTPVGLLASVQEAIKASWVVNETNSPKNAIQLIVWRVMIMTKNVWSLVQCSMSRTVCHHTVDTDHLHSSAYRVDYRMYITIIVNLII